jgi:glucose-1-phosphate adenylyltransferase
VISGGRVDRTVLSPNVRINSYAHVEGSILFDNVDVGRHCRLRRVIVDKGVRLPPGTEIGFDHERDAARGLTVADGIVVIPQNCTFT